MKAGIGCVEITPDVGCILGGYGPRRSSAVHDPLYARCLYLEGRGGKVCIVSCDLLGLYRGLVKEIKKAAQERCGVQPENLVIACTHTHSGPDTILLAEEEADYAYQEALIGKIAEAVNQAVSGSRTARVATGRGEAHIGINRRAVLRDGSIRLGHNHKGPVDERLYVIRVDDADGTPMALLMNYGCHPVVLGRNTEISRDYPGYAVAIAERRFGGTALFTNGAGANVNPHFDRLVHRDNELFAVADELGDEVGRQVVEVARRLEPEDEVRLGAMSRVVKLPLNEGVSREAKVEPDSARKRIGELARQMDALYVPARLSPEKKQELMKLKAEHDSLYISTFFAKRWGVEFDGDNIVTEIQALAIGHTGFVALPGEVVVEVGSQIRHWSPFMRTAIISCANDYIGYLPTRRIYDDGGLEGRRCFVRPQSIRGMIYSATEMLEALL